MKLNVYGKIVEITRQDSKWNVFYLGNEGKKRLANGIYIPSVITQEDIPEYLADLCHEWATPEQNEVKVLY